MRLRYMKQGMENLGDDAVNLREQDAELDLATLQAALGGSRLPFVSANLVRKSDHQRLAAPYRILRRGALKVGVTGVTAAEPRDVGPGLEVRPPLEALDEVVPELK